MGWICSAIGVATTLFLITQGSSIYIIAGSLGISVLLAFAGAPIAAIGSQTNENKKQTEILYCQANSSNTYSTKHLQSAKNKIKHLALAA